MKLGKTNKLDNVSSEITYTSSVTSTTGFPESNIADPDSLKLWKVTQGTVDLVIEWTTGFTAQMIGLFNVNLETNVTITTYSSYPSSSIESKVIALADLTGFEWKNGLFELTNTSTSIKAIKLAFTGATPTFKTYAGYIWVGDWVNFGCAETMQAIDASADQATVSRTNRPDTNEEYDFQSYAITLKKTEGFTTVRSNIRTILNLGYATPRPVIIDEPFFTSSEVFYGILDAPTVKYDTIVTGDTSTYLAQTTIGLREVT
jgi:hypothetical protein